MQFPSEISKRKQKEKKKASQGQDDSFRSQTWLICHPPAPKPFFSEFVIDQGPNDSSFQAKPFLEAQKNNFFTFLEDIHAQELFGSKVAFSVIFRNYPHRRRLD